MKLINLIILIAGDEVLHISKGDKSLWIGKTMNAIGEIADDILCSKVKNIHTGFSGLCVEIW